MMNFFKAVLLASLFLSLPIFAQQEALVKAPKEKDAVQTPSLRFLALESTIVGNKEQPKVITIVPWQSPEQQAVISKPIVSEIQLVFQPIEISSLQKELEYFNRHKQ